MTLGELLDQKLIKGELLVECDTSKEGKIKVLLYEASEDAAEDENLIELWDRKIMNISKSTERGVSGICIKLEGVRRNLFEKTMFLFKCVSKFYDNGKTSAVYTEEIVQKKPESSSRSTDIFDEYIEWFDTQTEAEKWKEKVLNA